MTTVYWKIVLHIDEVGRESYRPYMKAGHHTFWMWRRLAGEPMYDYVTWPVIEKQEKAMRYIEDAIKELITKLRADVKRKKKGGIVAHGYRTITDTELNHDN